MGWTQLWHNVLQWVALHPMMAYLAIFLVALSESLALVGLLVPGTVIMIAIGAIAGSGALSLKLTLLAAIAGAINGDGISYWLGRHYHQGLKTLWPFRQHPQMLIRGEVFFQKHGGKSVLFGRFVGPVRPVIPVIAGMLDMPAGRFVLVNIASAVGWAFAYIIPGVLLGGSLTLIGAVSTRLSLMLLLLVLLIWLAFWLLREAFRWLGRLGPKGERLLLPSLCLTLFVAGWIFFGVLEDVLTRDPLILADQAVFQFLQTLRTPWGDQLLVAVTEMGDSWVSITIAASALAVLLLQRKFRSAGFWLFAVGGGAGWVLLLKWALQRPRPIAIYHGVSGWAFPSGHTTMSVVVFGFLAILLVRRFSPQWRWLPFAVTLGYSLLIAFSRIFLGAHWLSDVLGGLALGWAWVTFVGIFYLGDSKMDVSARYLLTVVLLAMVLAGSVHIHNRHEQDMLRYQVQKQIHSLSVKAWQQTGWQRLPSSRIDLEGEIEQPLTFQWAGDPARLAEQLTMKGWTQITSINFKQLLNVFVPNVGIQELPLLPRWENGQQERLWLSLGLGVKRVVLRLWPSTYRLAENDRPLWVGTVESERAYSVADILTFPKGIGDFNEGLQIFAQTISPRYQGVLVTRPSETIGSESGWNGRVLLTGENLPVRSPLKK